MFATRNLWIGSLSLLLVGGCGQSSSPESSATSPSPSVAKTATTAANSKGGAKGSAGAKPGAVADDPRSKGIIAGYDVRDDQHPILVLRTNRGDITLRLNAEKAPRTVYNFMSYASAGHYDQTIFHQVDANYAMLGGSFTPDLKARPVRYPIHNEAANGLRNKRGTISMARSPEVVDSATCEFFINLVDNPQLDHAGSEPQKFGYCVFGEVIDGMDVVDKIAKVQVTDSGDFAKLPTETVMIQYVRRLVY